MVTTHNFEGYEQREENGDLVLFDSNGNEVRRIDDATGEITYSQPVGSGDYKERVESNGDLVLEDPNGTVVKRWDVDAGEWVFPAVSVDDIDLNGSDLIATGDFFDVYSISSYSDQLTTTSTSYVSDSAFLTFQVRWDQLRLNSHIQTRTVIDGRNEPADLRLRNSSDGEDVFEILDITTDPSISRVDSYTPTTTDSRRTFQPEIRADDGDNSARMIGGMTVAIGGKF